jgi:hypothetical protein
LAPRSEGDVCAHSDGEPKCPRRAVVGHIFCEPCRIESGGYIRYTRLPASHEAVMENSTTAQRNSNDEQNLS